MSDLISRQAAIDALDKRFDSIPMEQTTEILLLRKDLRNLPSAQPERKTGKWIKRKHGYWSFVNDKGERDGWIPSYECSECGSGGWRNPEVMNFCPSCGAKMDAEVADYDK